MKTILFYLTTAIILSGSLAAQYHPGGHEVTADRDSLLKAGMDELLSYMLLTTDDFIFRDDYTQPDPFRLRVVDSLMHSPLDMNEFTSSIEHLFLRFDADPAGALLYLGDINGSWKTDFSRIPDDSVLTPRVNKLARDSLTHFDGAARFLGEHISMSSNKLLYTINHDWTPEVRDLVTKGLRELILEDVASASKSAEEQDSVSKIEEEYAIEIARNSSKIFCPGFGFYFNDILKTLEEVRDDCTNDSLYINKTSGSFPTYFSESGFGNIVVGTRGPDVYNGDFFIIIDPGGNDVYNLSYDVANPHPVIIADFSGDDIYNAETEFALACGAFGYSLLVDYAGDDIYRGGNFSLGAGYFGVGILWDKKGNDSYFGDTFTQGAGTFGLGLLIDSDGSDTYTGNLFCQGFGFTDGIGGIIDNSGNDIYAVQPKYGDFIRYEDHYISLSQGFGYGIRPFLSGGFGFIADYAGNDTYVSDIFGQGASYWWSLGMLYDKSGNDQYLSHQYAQGNGTHMSLGILRDDAGNDIYRAYGVSQGCGHDYSCGWLQDRDGNDTYVSFDLSQGAGQANGFGIFTDLVGNDRYYVMLKTNTQGYGNPRRDYGSIGIFLDLDGDDRYEGNGSNNRYWNTGSKWGGGLDRTLPAPDTTQTTEADDADSK